MQKKAFIATGALALVGGLATAVFSSSCDTDCTLEARASVILTVTMQDGSALDVANVDQVWYRVTDDAGERSAGDAPDGSDPGSTLSPPESEWKVAECYDAACTRYVLGYETPGTYEIRASVCGQDHLARAVVDMTADGCHVDTEEIEIMVDGDGCAEDDGPVLDSGPACTLEARPSMVIELFDPDKGTIVEVEGDSVYATPKGESTAIAGSCLNENCSVWSVGLEQPGSFTVHADVCGETSTMDVTVPMTPDECHVDTQYLLMEVDSSACPLPFDAQLPDYGPTCDRMARPSAFLFVAQDFGDVWAPIEPDAVWYENGDTREKAWCLEGDCSLGVHVAGWELDGRFKAHADVCGKTFTTTYTVPKTDDGCHVETQYIPLMVDKDACPGQR